MSAVAWTRLDVRASQQGDVLTRSQALADGDVKM